MKPHRMRMTHNLLLNYGLYRKMEVYRPHKATQVKEENRLLSSLQINTVMCYPVRKQIFRVIGPE